MNQDVKFQSDAKARFLRAIRRLGLLSKFANSQGKELDLENIEISHLTEHNVEDCLEFEEEILNETEQEKD